ncbi:hypothetical protein B0H11DRAFT_2056633 [Mycena galericulata]|nr:hypothetical protein B0H11DRAFT_2056633 [Mycena galericulata]
MPHANLLVLLLPSTSIHFVNAEQLAGQLAEPRIAHLHPHPIPISSAPQNVHASRCSYPCAHQFLLQPSPPSSKLRFDQVCLA